MAVPSPSSTFQHQPSKAARGKLSTVRSGPYPKIDKTSDGVGWITSPLSAVRGQTGTMGPWQTDSMGIIFIPFVCGVVALFVDATKSLAWYLPYFGIFILAIEILSRLQFVCSMKTSHLLLMLGTFAAGTGIMFRSYRTLPQIPDEQTTNKSDQAK